MMQTPERRRGEDCWTPSHGQRVRKSESQETAPRGFSNETRARGKEERGDVGASVAGEKHSCRRWVDQGSANEAPVGVHWGAGVQRGGPDGGAIFESVHRLLCLTMI
ncbi:hypothetical protein PMIN06_010695 [Paraphaeosphaeria minitans]